MIVLYYMFLAVNIFLASLLIYFEAKRNSPFLLLWLSLIAIYFIPSSFDYNLYYIQPHSLSVVLTIDHKTLLISQIFAFAVMFFYLLFMYMFVLVFGFSRYEITMVNDQKIYLALIWVFLYIAIFSLVIIYFKFGVEYFTTYNFVEAREEIPFYLKVGSVYTQLLAVGLGFYYARKKRHRMIVVLFGLFLIFFLLIGGSRQPLVLFMISAFMGFVLTNNYSFKHVAMLILVAQPILYFLQLLLALRNTTGFIERVDLFSLVMFGQEGIDASREETLRFAYYYFISQYGNVDIFQSFSYLFRTLMFWIPTSLSYGIKPADFEYEMFSVYMPGFQGTLHPTLFGTIFADTGWYFVIWSLYFSLISFFMPYVFNKLGFALKSSLFGLLCYCAIMYSRGAFYGATVILFYSVLVLYIYNVYFSKRGV